MFVKVGKSIIRQTSTRNLSTLPSYVVNASLTELTTAGNGVRVASESAHGETATVGVWIDAGSRYETEKNNGVANLLRRTALKGTNKRTQKQLESEIESIGGHFNTYSSREQTVFLAQVFKQDVPKAMEILADIVQHSLLSDAAIASERETIIGELLSRSHDQQLFEHLHETAFMGTGLGLATEGTEESLRSLSKADLQSFLSANYTADRVVVAGAGAVEHGELVKLTEQHFGKLTSAPKGGLASPYDPAIFTGSDKRIRFDSMNEAHIALAFQGASSTSEHAFPLSVMQTILGSWDQSSPSGRNAASKLAQNVSEFELAHSFKTFNISYKDTGLFGIHLVAPDNKLDDAMWYTLDNLVRLCHNVSDEEVVRAKTQLKSNILFQQESSAKVADDIGRQILSFGRRMTLAEVFARIDAITTADVKTAANKYINDEDHALAAVGPIFELPDYNYIRRRSYWHRY
jgi:mitochondrial-processing peptidase subunit beta